MKATGYQKYIVQAEHNLRVLNSCFFGERDKKGPGIIDFQSQMVDIYNRWYEYTDSHKTNVFSNSILAEYIKKRKLTLDEVCKLFLFRNTGFDCSAKRVAEGYERLMQEGEKLNDFKKKAVYTPNGKKAGIYEDMLYDINGFCYRNDKFLDTANAMIGMMEKRPQNNNLEDGTILAPLTDDQQKKLDEIEANFYNLVQRYNEDVLDDTYGVVMLYNAIRKLATEKLPKYAGIKHDVRETTFPDKQYAIPRKYVKKEEFNPYYVAKKRRSVINIENLSSDEYMY